MPDYNSGVAWIRDLAGNHVRVATLVEEEARPGSAALTVDNTVDPPAEVTTIVAPGATIDGDEATLGGAVTIRSARATVAFDTVGLYDAEGTGDGIAFTTLAGGGTLIDVQVYLTGEWLGGVTNPYIFDVLAPSADTPEIVTVNVGDGAGSPAVDNGPFIQARSSLVSDAVAAWLALGGDVPLTVRLSSGVGEPAPTAGSVYVVAILAEPA